MTAVFTLEPSPLPLGWTTETNTSSVFSHPGTTNVRPIALGGLWKGQTISAEDIQQTRKDLWSKLEAGD